MDREGEENRDEEGTGQEEEEEEQDEEQHNAFLQHLLASMVLNRNRTASNNDQLIINLKRSGVLHNLALEEAFKKIPRGIFVPDDMQDEAYVDTPLRLAAFGFNISAPHVYAMSLEALNVEPGNTFLDIGSGCGHLTALAGYLTGKAGRADGIDLLPEYIDFAKNNMKKLKAETGMDLGNVNFEVRNCFLPDIKERTYDRIHVGACCPTARKDTLINLLTPGGILVTPMEDAMVKITKSKDGKTTTVEKLASVRYGDLKVPSDAEIKEATLALERKRATTIVVPPDTYREDFAGLLNNQLYSDVTLKVENRSIPAHRFILKIRCEHFRAMFENGLRESRSDEVVLHDTEYKPFMGCLQFIYTGDVPIPDADTAIELIAEANKLQLSRLKALCEDIISKSMEVENAAYIYQVASHHNATQLKRIALDFILTRFDTISHTKCFADMDKDLIIELTQEACKLLTRSRGDPQVPC